MGAIDQGMDRTGRDSDRMVERVLRDEIRGLGAELRNAKNLVWALLAFSVCAVGVAGLLMASLERAADSAAQLMHREQQVCAQRIVTAENAAWLAEHQRHEAMDAAASRVIALCCSGYTP